MQSCGQSLVTLDCFKYLFDNILKQSTTTAKPSGGATTILQLLDYILVSACTDCIAAFTWINFHFSRWSLMVRPENNWFYVVNNFCLTGIFCLASGTRGYWTGQGKRNSHSNLAWSPLSVCSVSRAAAAASKCKSQTTCGFLLDFPDLLAVISLWSVDFFPSTGIQFIDWRTEKLNWIVFLRVSRRFKIQFRASRREAHDCLHRTCDFSFPAAW